MTSPEGKSQPFQRKTIKRTNGSRSLSVSSKGMEDEAGNPKRLDNEAETSNMSPLVTEMTRLRCTLTELLREKSQWSTRLVGIQNLARQLQDKKAEVNSVTEKLERTQETLSRAENRITQLSLILEKNGVSSQGAIVTPGVSKKILEALTRENTKLRSNLERFSNEHGNGVDLAAENAELHEIIMKLRGERNDGKREVKELKRLLTAIQDGDTDALKEQNSRLTREVTKLQRQLEAKQVFCELIVSENESMKEKLHSDKGEKVVNVGRLKEVIGSVAEAHADVGDILKCVWDDAGAAGRDERDARHEDARETVEDGQVAEGMAQLEDAKRKTNRLGKELVKQSALEDKTEMSRNKLTEMEEEQDLLRGELEKAMTESKENAKLVEGLRKKLSTLQEDIFQTTRQRDDFEAQLKEVQDELQQTHLALTSYVKKEREAAGDPEAMKKVVECEREKVAKLQRDILQTTRQRDDFEAQLKEVQDELRQTHLVLTSYVKKEREAVGDPEAIKKVVECEREKVAKLQRDILQTTRQRDEFQAKLQEVQDELQLAQMALKSYEDDFKKERQEKLKAAGDLEATKKANRRLAGECERFQKNYLDLTHRIHQGHSSTTTGAGAFRPRAECRQSVQAPPSKPRVPASNELQCPNCQRMFPSHLLDEHMRACSN